MNILIYFMNHDFYRYRVAMIIRDVAIYQNGPHANHQSLICLIPLKAKIDDDPR